MYGASPNPNGLVPRDRTPVAVTVDNLIRRRLRIGDPNSAAEVADGLRKLFAGDARALDLEAKGLPFLPPTVIPPSTRPFDGGPSGADLQQAVDDVDRDLRALTTNSQLKDIEPELSGWGQAIRAIIADGTAAAPLALDPRARDRAFAARRQLGDYARMARLVGAMTQTLNGPYRRLAQSLDESAAVIVVIAGEAISAMGMGGGQFLLAAPASELQARRDAVLMALRTLAGTTQVAYGNAEWPWGLHGLREILVQIERSGHLDLRSLLDENVLARLMDDLIDRAATNNSRGLRALGATADVALQRLYRLLHIVDNRIDPQAPAVATLFKAIQLFLDAFASSRSGYRLPTIARSPLLLNGLRGLAGADEPTDRLLKLIHARGQLAELLDCYLGCGCCGDEVLCQILLDKLLYDTDRAIDLYTLGSDPAGRGEPEWRAAAYGVLIEEFETSYVSRCLSGLLPTTTATIASNLLPFRPQPPSPKQDEEEPPKPCLDFGRTCNVVEASATCSPRVQELRDVIEEIQQLLIEGKIDDNGMLPVTVFAASQAEADGFIAVMRDELCLQRLADRRWASLVATMAPGCVPTTRVLDEIDRLVRCSIRRLHDQTALSEGTDCTDCPEPDLLIPPTVETSFAGFVHQQPSEGGKG